MKIKFIGAVGGDVTGSCTLCCARNGTRFLVDCGELQGGGFAKTRSSRFPFDPGSIDFVLLTHAHLDHCGRIPDLYKAGFTGKVICNKITRDLAIINMPIGDDSVVAWRERFITEEQRPEIGGTESFIIDNDLRIAMLRSSHFLGSCSFVVKWNMCRDDAGVDVHQSKSICFSGDLGGVVDNDKNYLSLLKDGYAPNTWIDYFVMESTYGARSREAEYKDFSNRITRLEEIISADDISTFVFACFSMQRTQDVLFDLLYLAMNEERYKCEIVLDSPAAIDACRIYNRALCETKGGKNGKPEKFRHLNNCFVDRFMPLLENYIEIEDEKLDRKIHTMRKFISDVFGFRFKHENVRVINGCDKNSNHAGFDCDDGKDLKRIYITSSGMFQYGPVVGHLGDRHGDAKTAFVITGFCNSTENGKVLTAWCNDEDAQEKRIVTGGNHSPIKRGEFAAKIYNVASYYSGHADADALLRFLFHSTKEVDESEVKKRVTVFLNHGDASARAALKAKIESERQKDDNTKIREVGDVILPQATDSFFDLDTGKFVAAPELLLPFHYSSLNLYPAISAQYKKSEGANMPPERLSGQMAFWVQLLKFWDGLGKFAKQQKSTLKLPLPQSQPRLSTYIAPNVNIVLNVDAKSKKIGCAIHILNARELYDFLFEQKDDIERALQELHGPFKWDGGKKNCRISLTEDVSEDGNFLRKESTWEKRYEWMLTAAEKFREVFLPRIKVFKKRPVDIFALVKKSEQRDSDKDENGGE